MFKSIFVAGVFSLLSVSTLYAESGLHSPSSGNIRSLLPASLSDNIKLPECKNAEGFDRPIYRINLRSGLRGAILSTDLETFLLLSERDKSNIEMVSFPYFNQEEASFAITPKLGGTGFQTQLSEIIGLLGGRITTSGNFSYTIQCEEKTPDVKLTHNSAAALPTEEKISHDELLKGKFNSVPNCFKSDPKGVIRIWKALNYAPAQSRAFSSWMNLVDSSGLKLLTAPRVEEIVSSRSSVPFMLIEVKITEGDTKAQTALQNLKNQGARMSCVSEASMPTVK